MFALMQSTRLESLHLSVDPVTGLKAVIAIHNSRLGPPWVVVVTLPTPTTNLRSRMRCAWPRA
jgi:hypothetical protein